MTLFPIIIGIQKSFKYVTRSTATTITGLLVLLVLFGVGFKLTHAATLTSYDVTNETQMNLDVSISATQTTGIILSAPQLNATNHVFATTTGGILRIRYGAYREDISYTGATVNSSNFKVTLLGVTRNICPQVARSIISCGAGRAWGKGAIVELNIDARLLNLKANIDRPNTFLAPVGFSGSGSFKVPVFVTTTARDLQIPSPANGMIVYVTGDGVLYQYIAGSWTTFASGTTTNATETSAGKLQISTLANLLSLTATGSSGAQNAVPVKWVIKNGSGTISAGRIPQLNQNGRFASSFFSATNSGIVVTKTGTGVSALAATSSGQVLMANATNTWKPSSNLGYVIKKTYGTDKLTMSSGDQNFATTVVLPANSLLTGSILRLVVTGSGMQTAGGPIAKHGLKLGSTELCRSNQWAFGGSFERRWIITATMTVQSVGSTGKITTDCDIREPDSGSNGLSPVGTLSGSIVTINTTVSNTINTFVNPINYTGFSWLIQLFAQFYP